MPKLSSDDKPSGKNKKNGAELAKFVTSMTNQLSMLKAKYHEHCSQFRSTGSGIVPLADSDAGSHPQNLLELNSIWNSILSFNSELLSPKSSASHSQNLLKIIKRKPGEAPDEEEEENDVEAEVNKMNENKIVIVEKESTGTSDLENQAPSSTMCLDKPNATEDSGINDAFMNSADVHRVCQVS
ncbi:hypothetical protein JVU11DRAFT_7833 [Chiua virens]|nr:hypothetical protein JVU11DRAFT_7833 [Chiua virens]